MNHPDQDGLNRLAGEKSPYLLQHARNPVNWYPWGDEAFEEARRLDRPLFLRDFPFVAAHRLMQALGAYAFLGSRRGKRDFLGFISPALRLLREIQGTLPAGAFPEFDRAVALAQERWEERPETS